MAKKKTFPQWQIDVLGIALSVSGGAIGSFGMTQANLNVKKFEEMPALAPTGVALIGGLVVFLSPPAVKPLGHGMLGATGSSGVDMVINGLSRIEIQGDEIQGRIETGEDEVDRLTRENAAIQDAADTAESVSYKMMGSDDGTS